MGSGEGGVVPASVRFQHFPAMCKCQLSVANYSCFKRVAGNKTVCAKSPIIFKHWQVSQTLETVRVGQDVSVVGSLFQAPTF